LAAPKAVAAARRRRADMNVLVCLSILGAGYLGEWLEGATLAWLYSLANLLESWSISRARAAIGTRIEAAPRAASMLHSPEGGLFGGSHPPRALSEQYVESFARRYTPAMILVALLVAAVPPFIGGDWRRWFELGMLTLLISCPCALVISTPVTIASALAAAARRDIFIRGGAHLEAAAGLRAVVLRAGAAGVETSLRDLGVIPVVRSDALAAVRELLAGHHPVAVAGDAARDAQAMAVATLGVAVGHPGEADVALLSGDLGGLPFLVRHARRTLAVIRQNVGLALGAKVGFLALAWLGFATLWMAVAADMGAILLVTFNGLRLLRAPE
jgi:cation transport ATPase